MHTFRKLPVAFRLLSVLLVVAGLAALNGCRKPVASGPSAAGSGQPVMEPVLEPASDIPPAANQAGDARPVPREDDPAGQPIETVDRAAESDQQNATSSRQNQNPLTRGFGDLLDSSPIFDSPDQQSLRRSLSDADRTLTEIKDENITALRNLDLNELPQRTVKSRPRASSFHVRDKPGAKLSTGEPSTPTRTPAPNLLFIVASGVGPGDLGCYGGERVKTPNLDDLAMSGMRFTQANAGDPNGDVSRWCWLTGWDTSRAYPRGGTSLPLPAEHITLPETLWQAGYATAFIGQWGLGEDRRETMPHLHGFDQWLGVMTTESQMNHFPETVYSDGVLMRLPANLDQKAGQLDHDLYVQEALAFLDQRTPEKRFLAMLSLSIPMHAGRAFDTKDPARADWTPEQRARAAALERLDADVGRLIQRLNDLDLRRNTLVIFTSSHAPQPASGLTDFFNTNLGSRAEPNALYEGNLRVPMIASWPGVIAPQSFAAFATTMCDWSPTVADLAGASNLPRGLDGVSLKPVLLEQTPPERGMLYWEMRRDGFTQAVRRGRWKVVRPAGKLQREAVELYDLEMDPRETRDVADENPQVVAEFIRS
ncbi:MAG: sulfatase-like hydrolase/transferase [Planctomycetales bacterium]|nr:sulfatase-like hydrolase/transferase [Planctomycetales bacterium]